MKYRVLHVPDMHAAFVLPVPNEHKIYRRVVIRGSFPAMHGEEHLQVYDTRQQAEQIAKGLLDIQDKKEKQLYDFGKTPNYNTTRYWKPKSCAVVGRRILASQGFIVDHEIANAAVSGCEDEYCRTKQE